MKNSMRNFASSLLTKNSELCILEGHTLVINSLIDNTRLLRIELPRVFHGYKHIAVTSNYLYICAVENNSESHILVYGRENSGNKLETVLDFNERIVALKSNSHMVIAVTETMFQLICEESLRSTPIEIKHFGGLLEMSETGVVWSSSDKPGYLNIAKIRDFSQISTMKCHIHDLQCINFSNTGTNIVTTSCKGTLIKIFDLESQRIVRTFRRGYTNRTNVYVDSVDGVTICLSVKSLHIFFESGKHIVIAINGGPNDCKYCGKIAYVTTCSGNISAYAVDREKETVAMLYSAVIFV